MPETKRIGKYEILEEIGRGGFAVVYKARDPDLDRVVALKVLHTAYTERSDVVKRFLVEARQAARLRHNGIVRILDVGEDQQRPYIAMEYLPGGNLAARLTGEPLPLETAATILEQVAAALDYAHQRRLVHRDVKPANVLFDEDGHAVLADFGLVKSLVDSGMTTENTVLGTPTYMSPEQCTPGAVVSPATDIYALGVVAYEMLTGRVPFQAETPLAVVHAHIYETPPDPQTVCEALPASAAQALLKALSKSPGERYPTGMAMVEALRQAEKDALVDEQEKEAKRERSLAPKRLSVWAWVAAGALVLALVAAAVGLGSFIGDKTTPTPEATTAVALKPTDMLVATGAPTAMETQTVAVVPAESPTYTLLATYTLRPTGTPNPMDTDTAVPTPPTRTDSTPTREDTHTAVSPSPTVAENAGKLSLQVPEGVSLGSSTVYDQATGNALGSVNGTGPFWLPPGTYRITLRDPFVGVSLGDVTVESGQETSVDVSQGLGTLSLQVPEGVSPWSTSISDQATGNTLGSVSGTGPFWLPPGTYSITLRDPFVGVGLGGVTVESGKETSVDVSRGLGTLSLQAPEGISPRSTYISDQATEEALGSVNGTGPFWLPPGTYRITLRDPFAGVGLGDVTVESDKETSVDVSQGLGTLSLQVPEGISPWNTSISDQATENALGSVNGTGPFWLPPGIYSITLRNPFVGVSLGDVTVESGKETPVDVSQGLGTLSLQAPEGVSLGSSTVYNQATEEALGSANGTGPFWLLPGTYRITLRDPFVGVSLGDVTVESGKETSVDVSQGLGTLSLQVPEGVSSGSSTVYDQTTEDALGSVNGTGPFWLLPGTYRITLRDPFVGVSLGDMTVESGKETSVDVSQGLGTLSLQVPEGVSLGSSTVYNQATEEALGSVSGTGPFWLPPGTYSITLRDPFVGVSLKDVTVQSDRETVIEVR